MHRVSKLPVVVCLSLIATLHLGAQDEAGREDWVRTTYDLRSVVDLPDSPLRAAPHGHLVFASQYDSPANRVTPRYGDERAPVDGGTAEIELTSGAKRPSPTKQAHRFTELLDAFLTDWESGETQSQISVVSGNAHFFGPPSERAIADRVVQFAQRARTEIAVEVLLVPVGAMDSLVPDWEARVPTLTGEECDALFLDERTALFSVTARSGQLVTNGTRRVRALITDHEINQTGVIPTTNPVLSTPRAGDLVHARPLLLPDGKVFIDFAFESVALQHHRQELGIYWGELDLPVSRERLISMSTVLTHDRPVVLGWLGADNSAVLIGRARVAAKEALPQTEQRLQAYELGVVTRDSSFRRWWKPGPFADTYTHWDMAEAVERLIGEAAMELDRGRVQFHEGVLFVDIEPDSHEAIAQFVATETNQRTQLVTFKLEELEISRQAFSFILGESADGFILAENWREELQGDDVISRTSYGFSGVCADVQVLRHANLKSLITGVENVSGGTGFAIIERTDPVVGRCGSGSELRVKIDLVPDTDNAFVQLKGVSTELVEMRSALATYPSVGAQTQSGSALTRVVKEIHVGLPEQNVRHWNVQRQVPIGRDVVLHASTAVGAGGTLLIARVERPE